MLALISPTANRIPATPYACTSASRSASPPVRRAARPAEAVPARLSASSTFAIPTARSSRNRTGTSTWATSSRFLPLWKSVSHCRRQVKLAAATQRRSERHCPCDCAIDARAAIRQLQARLSRDRRGGDYGSAAIGARSTTSGADFGSCVARPRRPAPPAHRQRRRNASSERRSFIAVASMSLLDEALT